MRDKDNCWRSTTGRKFRSVLKQQGYQSKKQMRHKGWTVHPDSYPDVLTYVPVSVGNWSLIPNNTKETRTRLWGIVQNALYAIRENL